MDQYFIETTDPDSGNSKTHARCMECGQPIKDLAAANILGDNGRFIGFFHQTCDDKKLPDSENLRDWLCRLLWNGGVSDEEYNHWVADQDKYGT